MIEEHVIIGGGVAGLSAAITMAERGKYPLLIEGGKYPTHRICGEFFSPESLPILKQWKIPLPIRLSKACFVCGPQSFEFNLHPIAGGCSRFSFDYLLLEHARRLGVRVLTETQVMKLESNEEYYEINLANGQTIQAQNLIVGTGKNLFAPTGHTLPSKYVGIKAHFEGIQIHEVIEMHCFRGGYMGISRIDPHTVNVAALVSLGEIREQAPEAFFNSLLLLPGMEKLKGRFAEARMLFPDWLRATVPEFGIRSPPLLNKVFWIGDAAASIPPLCGGGLGMAITSGRMLGDYIVEGKADVFHQNWRRRYSRRIMVAQILHQIMMKPWTAKWGTRICQLAPFLPRLFYRLTRED